MTTSVALRPALAAQSSQRQNKDILSRLHKAQGQLSGVTSMYVAGRPCTDILDQLTAARAAVDAVGLIVFEEHLNACMLEGFGSGDNDIAQLMTTVRRFVRSR